VSIAEATTTIAMILLIMAALSAIELAIPLFSPPAHSADRRVANLGLTAATFGVNWAFTSLAAVLAVVQEPGVMVRVGFPWPGQIFVSVVALDFFFGYVAHVALHVVPPLWRVHAVHHSDPFVDVTTTYRTHPIESVWRSTVMLIPVWLLGVPASALVVYRALSAINGLLEHANLRVWPGLDRALSVVWVTPNMHKVHHSRRHRETNSNYGNLLSVYDRVFRTFTNTERGQFVEYGLNDTDPQAVIALEKLLAMRVRARKERHDKSQTVQR
jgi:sterol desaturase/sphingolipid hydroxylase (fatty acid hydroxylase superfamily)